MPAHCQGLDQCTNLETDIVREWLDSTGWANHVLADATAPARQPYEAIAITAVDKAPLAGSTVAIVYRWLYTDPLTDLEGVHILANFFDDSREFVAQRQWGRFACDPVWFAGRWN